VEAVLVGLVVLAWIFTGSVPAEAQNVGDVYRKVNSTVVVVKAQGRDVNASGFTSFTETGSGVIISADGKVMTAAHVVHAMDEISVQILGGESVKAKVVASEPAADLSLLQMERMPKGAMVSKLADSNTVRVGDRVIIVGAPYGLAHSLTSGLISARWAPNTVYRAMPLAEFFQTDAVINTGNSGGPMFNMAGEVIGIVSHNISKSGGSEGLGFVVTGNTARQLLLEKRSFWSGLEGQLLTDSQADVLNLPPRKLGYIVKTVAKGSPAEAAGVKGGATTATIDGESLVVGGDIILSVEGIEVTKSNLTRIRDALNKLRSGETFKATVLRAGRVVALTGRVP
jgi:S1-C subfamily serine protease